MKGEAKRRAMEEKWKARRAAAGEGEGGGDHEEQRKPKSAMPQKRFYRARAHSNPLSDSYFPVPTHPGEVNWHEHFPAFFLPPPPLVQEPGNQDVPATEAEEVAGDAAAAAQKGDSGAGGSGAQEAPAGPVPAVQVATGEGRPNGGAEEHNGGEQAAAPPGAGTSGDPVAGGGLSTGGAGTGDVPLVRFADVGCGFGGLLGEVKWEARAGNGQKSGAGPSTGSAGSATKRAGGGNAGAPMAGRRCDTYRLVVVCRRTQHGCPAARCLSSLPLPDESASEDCMRA